MRKVFIYRLIITFFNTLGSGEKKVEYRVSMKEYIKKTRSTNVGRKRVAADEIWPKGGFLKS